jgi:CubicO group peptidase (beta-lactamase class C family)
MNPLRLDRLFLALSLVLLLIQGPPSFAEGPAFSEPAQTKGLSKDVGLKIRASTETIMKTWNIPGAAVAIVKDGEIVFSEGFGQRDLEKGLPVTPRTRFILGSTTKAFTALAVGLLATENKLDWDKALVNFLPEFRLQDDYTSFQATPRDLAAHRTGLPRHDLVWVNSPLDIAEMVRSLRYLEPSRELRAAFQYNNLMYITLGYLVERTAGMPWDHFVRERIFKPLEMNESGCTIPEFVQAPEYAFSYVRKEGKQALSPLPQPADRLMYGARASGSVNTTAQDMCRWITAHLEDGRVDGRQALPQGLVSKTHAPQIPIPWSPASNPETLLPSYALGWMTDVYRGHYRVHHGGSTLEYNSYVTLFPHDKMGLVVLINASSPASTILASTVSDLALGLDTIDWSERVEKMMKAGSEGRPKEKRVEGTVPAHKLDEYAAAYSHPAYGELRVEKVGDNRLMAVTHGFRWPLEHWHYETFVFGDGEFKGRKLSFLTNPKGEVDEVACAFEPAVKDIVFKKQSGSNGS